VLPGIHVQGANVSEQDDRIFLKRFSLVITGLAVFAVLIVFFAVGMNQQIAGSENPSKETAKAERIQPLFDVYVGESGREAAEAAMAETETETEAAEPQQVAMAEEMNGQAIYNDACQACHMAGAAGAPQLVAEQWTDRLDKGMDTLVSHAINGFNAMPAKGGRMDLSDEQVQASVEYMVEQVQ
jgi:cytochrome c5